MDAIVSPGENQRPAVSIKMAAEMMSRIYGLTTVNMKELNSYDDRNYHVTVKTRHENPHLNQVCSHGYVLKIINPLESKTNHVEVEFSVQRHLAAAGISCPHAAPSCDGRTYQLVNLEDYEENTTSTCDSLAAPAPTPTLNQVRLMEFVPGKLYNSVPYTPHLLASAGAFLGRLHNALKDYSDSRMTEGDTVWCLKNLSRVRSFLSAVTDVTKRRLAEDVINSFCDDVMNNTANFKRGTIHGDFNDMNILIKPSPCRLGDYDVTAVIDFGDVSDSFYVFEVGIGIMYVSVESREVEPLLAGGYFLSGYLRERHLADAEWRVLKQCACARYAQSLVLGAYYAGTDPDNEYVTKTSVRGWEQLDRMWNTPCDQLYRKWCDIIRDSGNVADLPF